MWVGKFPLKNSSKIPIYLYYFYCFAKYSRKLTFSEQTLEFF